MMIAISNNNSNNNNNNNNNNNSNKVIIIVIMTLEGCYALSKLIGIPQKSMFQMR